MRDLAVMVGVVNYGLAYWGVKICVQTHNHDTFTFRTIPYDAYATKFMPRDKMSIDMCLQFCLSRCVPYYSMRTKNNVTLCPSE